MIAAGWLHLESYGLLSYSLSKQWVTYAQISPPRAWEIRIRTVHWSLNNKLDVHHIPSFCYQFLQLPKAIMRYIKHNVTCSTGSAKKTLNNIYLNKSWLKTIIFSHCPDWTAWGISRNISIAWHCSFYLTDCCNKKKKHSKAKGRKDVVYTLERNNQEVLKFYFK